MKCKLLYPKTLSNGNILFLDKAYPMFKMVFPKEHPFSDNPEPFTFSNNPKSGDDRLSNFRWAGYYASCFPEGDGISFIPLRECSNDQIRQDVLTHLKVELE